jgi:hypothetical protein
MRQRVEQGVRVVTGLTSCLGVLLGAVSCIGGGRIHEGGMPTSPVAQFSAPNCEVHTQAGVSAAEANFFMIDGRRAFSLLVLDQRGKGAEIENYWKDEEGHHFVGNTQNGPAWHYLIPDKRGESGKLISYTTYALKPAGDHHFIEGVPTQECELKFLAAEPWQPPENSEAHSAAPAAPPPPPPPAAEPVRACVPGETRECVGAGACRGGHACLPDGSGFSACDCGSTATPQAPDSPPPTGKPEAAKPGKNEGVKKP